MASRPWTNSSNNLGNFEEREREKLQSPFPVGQIGFSFEAYHFAFGRGCRQPLDGEVGDGMESEADQVTLEVLLVKLSEKRFG